MYSYRAIALDKNNKKNKFGTRYANWLGRRGETGTRRPKAPCALKPNQAGKAGVREGCNPSGMFGCVTKLSRCSRRPEAGEGSPIRPPEPPRGNQAHACMNGRGVNEPGYAPAYSSRSSDMPGSGFYGLTEWCPVAGRVVSMGGAASGEARGTKVFSGGRRP